MKHNWEPVLWELWAALTLCAAAVLPPGSPWGRVEAVVWPGVILAAVVPAAWALWGLWTQPPQPLEPERLLEPAAGISAPVRRAAAQCDFVAGLPA